MRLILLLCAMTFSVAQAAELDSYLNIYNDARAGQVSTEDDEAIIYSRIETRVFPEIDRRLTDEEERALIETGVTSALGLSANPSAAIAEVQKKYDAAKSMLLLEKRLLGNLSESTTALPKFSNEAEEGASFDLVADLNRIDRILFGSKAETSDPNFAKEESEASTQEEKWQKGDPRNVEKESGISLTSGSPTDQFPEKEKSIAAAIEDLMSYTEKLNAKPLNLEYPTKKFFDCGMAMCQMAERIAFIARTRVSPQEFAEKPEVDGVQEDSFRELMDPIFTRYMATDNRDFYSGLDTQQGAVSSAELQEGLSDLVFNTQVNGITRGGQIFQQAQNADVQDKILEHLSLHLDSIKKQFLEIEETLESFYPANKERR